MTDHNPAYADEKHYWDCPRISSENNLCTCATHDEPALTANRPERGGDDLLALREAVATMPRQKNEDREHFKERVVTWYDKHRRILFKFLCDCTEPKRPTTSEAPAPAREDVEEILEHIELIFKRGMGHFIGRYEENDLKVKMAKLRTALQSQAVAGEKTEREKIDHDVLHHGTGFYIKSTDGIKHVPVSDVIEVPAAPPDAKALGEAIAFCEMVEEIGMPDDTVIPVWPIETEMVITHPLTVGMVKTFKAHLSRSVPMGDEGHAPEWFYRWVARAKAGYAGMSFEKCIDVIWHCPGNPYKENNPWADRAEAKGE